MGQWTKVAKVSDIPEGQMRNYEVDDEPIVICHTVAGFFVLADECSHDMAPISDGELRQHDIVCTRHGARFSLEDGSVAAPPAVVGIDRYQHKIDGDDILVMVD